MILFNIFGSEIRSEDFTLRIPMPSVCFANWSKVRPRPSIYEESDDNRPFKSMNILTKLVSLILPNILVIYEILFKIQSNVLSAIASKISWPRLRKHIVY